MKTPAQFADDLEELVSAEDFLDYFAIAYEAATVQVKHVIQYVHLKAGQAAPPGARVIQPDAPAQKQWNQMVEGSDQTSQPGAGKCPRAIVQVLK